MGGNDFADSVLYYWFGKFGSIGLVLKGRQFGSVDLVWYTGSGKLGLVDN